MKRSLISYKHYGKGIKKFKSLLIKKRIDNIHCKIRIINIVSV